jgi:hypothetical protein
MIGGVCERTKSSFLITGGAKAGSPTLPPPQSDDLEDLLPSTSLYAVVNVLDTSEFEHETDELAAPIMCDSFPRRWFSSFFILL